MATQERAHIVEEDIMIEVLKGFPDNVAAFAFHGHVTKTDYDTMLVPHFEDRLRRHKKVRIYCEIPPDFDRFDPGAAWEDTKFGFGHFFDWERAVLVTDVQWIQRAARFNEFFAFLWPGEYRAFSDADVARAREWIVEDHQQQARRPLRGLQIPPKQLRRRWQRL